VLLSSQAGVITGFDRRPQQRAKIKQAGENSKQRTHNAIEGKRQILAV
jgi:hypothetical protein